jgi:hypothetical protein
MVMGIAYLVPAYIHFVRIVPNVGKILPRVLKAKGRNIAIINTRIIRLPGVKFPIKRNL